MLEPNLLFILFFDTTLRAVFIVARVYKHSSERVFSWWNGSRASGEHKVVSANGCVGATVGRSAACVCMCVCAISVCFLSFSWRLTFSPLVSFFLWSFCVWLESCYGGFLLRTCQWSSRTAGVCVCVCAHVCVCVLACMYVYVRVCIYVYVCVLIN